MPKRGREPSRSNPPRRHRRREGDVPAAANPLLSRPGHIPATPPSISMYSSVLSPSLPSPTVAAINTSLFLSPSHLRSRPKPNLAIAFAHNTGIHTRAITIAPRSSEIPSASSPSGVSHSQGITVGTCVSVLLSFDFGLCRPCAEFFRKNRRSLF